jgi:hypothetical protein
MALLVFAEAAMLLVAAADARQPHVCWGWFSPDTSIICCIVWKPNDV